MADPDRSHRLVITDPGEARKLFRYINGEEWRDYRAIVSVFAQTFFAEFAPDDVVNELAKQGTIVDPDVMPERLEQLRRWGNLDASSSVGAPASLSDYYKRRNRYVISRAGQEVHALVEGVLTRIDEVRDVTPGRLRSIRDSLARLLDLDPTTVDPAVVSDTVRATFDIHREFADEVTSFFSQINQWRARFDLDPTEFQLFAEVLVGYVSDQLDEINRLARPVGALLAQLEPRIPSIIERMSGGLASRVESAGLGDDIRVTRRQGSDVADWDHLSWWFRSSPGRPSRVDMLHRDSVAAIRTLTLNLTRLSRLGTGSSSRRHSFLHLAAAFDDAADVHTCHHLAAGAFGLFPARHLGVVSDDVDDPVPTTTPWETAPRASVAVSLRQRGDTTNRGSTTPLRDRSAAVELLRRKREAEATALRAVDDELIAIAGSVDGVEVSVAALARLQQLVAQASHRRVAGGRREVSSNGLECRIEPDHGRSTTVSTPAGSLTMFDVNVTVGPASAVVPT